MNTIRNTLDDILYDVYTELLNGSFNINSSKSKNGLGPSSEILGNQLILTNPRSRLSKSITRGKAFSPIGEFLWYFTKDNRLDFILEYIPKYKLSAEKDEEGVERIYGGYGPRLFDNDGVNQILNILNLLKEKPSSRRAVIQIYDSKDLIGNHLDIPCTCFLQFFIRDNKLSLFVSMRSNDAYLGLPHDIFCFTMIQEIIAAELEYEMGQYIHSVSSLHLYEKHKKQAKQYLQEGIQSQLNPMTAIPFGNSLEQVEFLLNIEQQLRNNRQVSFEDLNEYWADFARLIAIFYASKNGQNEQVMQFKKTMKSAVFNEYINEKIK